MATPQLIETAYGSWLAVGKGWAVTGATEQEARDAFAAAEERHKRILALPPFYQQQRQPVTLG